MILINDKKNNCVYMYASCAVIVFMCAAQKTEFEKKN